MKVPILWDSRIIYHMLPGGRRKPSQPFFCRRLRPVTDMPGRWALPTLPGILASPPEDNQTPCNATPCPHVGTGAARQPTPLILLPDPPRTK